MDKKKKKKSGKIAPIIIGAIIIICCMIPVSSSLFGQTGYITEITSSERRGGEIDGELPNTYYWTVNYIFKTQNGESHIGSVQVKGDAVSSKSGLRVGSSVRYLAFAPRFNTPGDGGFDSGTIMYLLLIGFGVFMIAIGVRK